MTTNNHSQNEALPTAAPAKNYGLRAAAIAQTFLVAGSLNAQSDSNQNRTVTLEDETLKSEKAPELSSPKFTAPLRDTPKTINIIPSNVIEQQQAISLRDVLRNSPGITFRAGEGGTNGGDNLFVRGFSAEGDIFVDGVRNTTQYSRDAYNLAQVEVSKGPSSATSGRGSTGGSINMVTKQPFMADSTSIAVGLGSDSYKRVTIDSNSVIDADSGSALRISAMWTDLETPGRNGVEKSSWAINPTFVRDLSENVQMNLGYEHLEQDNIPDNGLWRDAATDSNYNWNSFYGLYERDYEKVFSDIFSANFSGELDNGLTVRYNTQFSDSSLDYAVTSPRVTTVDDVVLTRYSDLKQKDREFSTFSNDLSVRGEFGEDTIRNTFSAGIEYTKEGYTNFNRFHEGTAPTAPLYAPTPKITYDYAIGRTGAYTDTDAKTTALYFFDTAHLNEQWEINVGTRYERFQADQRAVDADGVLTEALSSDDKMLSWSGGLVYKPAENGSVYLGFGTSFSPSAEDLTLSSGSNWGSAPNDPDLDPEETRNLELGTKWDLANGALTLSGALFKTEKVNARTRTSRDENYILNGKQTIEGIEVGISGQLTERLSAYGGYSYLTSNVDSSPDPLEEGHELPYAPSQSLNFWTSYQATDKLSIGGGAQYTGDYYYSTTATDDSIPPQADYWLVDFMASYQASEDFSLQLNVKNLTDKVYVERGYPGHFTPGQNRSFIVSGTYRF